MRLVIFFALVFGSLSSVFGREVQEKEALIRLIAIEQPGSIDYFCKGKLYLRPDLIQPSIHGLMLQSGFSSLFLPTLFSDAGGCYLLIDGIILGSITSFIVKCWKCNTRWTYVSGVQEACPNCGTPP